MTRKKDENKSIFFDLPPHVYQDLLEMQHSKYILDIPIMKFLPKQKLKEVSYSSRLFYTSPNEIIISTGDMINEMYLIKRGTCEVLDPETKEIVKLITNKEHFGVLECLLRFPAYYTVRAVTHVEIYSISRKHLSDSLKIPQIKQTMEFAKLQKEYTTLLNRREPFVWYEPPPPAANRQFFKLPRKHEPDTAFQQPFSRLGVLSVLRLGKSKTISHSALKVTPAWCVYTREIHHNNMSGCSMIILDVIFDTPLSKYIFPRYTLRPDGKYLRRYETFRALCVVITIFLIPCMHHILLQYEWLHYLFFWLDIAAYYDLCQRMLVGYYNTEGVLVYHPAATAAHYLKGAFIVDVIGCFPLELLDRGRTSFYKGKIRKNRMIQFSMLNRLVQIYRLLGAIEKLRDKIGRADLLLVLKSLPVFIAAVNIVVCLIINTNLAIIPFKNGYSFIPTTNNTWLLNHKDSFRFNISETALNLHLAATFWVTYEMTSEGYNVINSSNYVDTLFLMVGIIIGYLTLTYFAARVIGIRAHINELNASFQENLKDIVLYMKREKLKQNLQLEVIQYYQYKWRKMEGTDYCDVLNLCEQITLQTDAVLSMFGQTFTKCPILYECDISLLRTVGRTVTSVYYLQGSHIIQKDDITFDMYIVNRGTVNVESDDYGITVSLQPGSMFGNLEPANTHRFPKTIVAASNVHLMHINSLTFHDIIMDYPTVQNLLKKHCPHNEVFILESKDEAEFVNKQSMETPSTFVLDGEKRPFKCLSKYDYYIDLYLILISLSCFYMDIYNIGFQDNKVSLIVFLYFMDMGFFLKILYYCTLPFFARNWNNKLILNDKRSKYLKSEFRCDIASCLPIELLCFIDPSQLWLWWSLLRINRALRLVTVYKCISSYKAKLNTNLGYLTIFSVFIWFTVFIHVATCLWNVISLVEESLKPKSSWKYDKNGKSLCDNQYICSIYFIVSSYTRNGVGDIMPMTQFEVAFVTIFLIFSSMLYMIYLGVFANIIHYQQFRYHTFYNMFLEFRQYLNNNHVSVNLVKRIDRYVLHIWRKTRGLQMPTFISTAPPVLKQKIMSAAYMRHLIAHPTFKDCEPAFLRQLVQYLKIYIYNDDMYVLRENDVTDSMYFVHTGRIQEFAEDTEQVTGKYNSGDHFGTVNGLNPGTPFINTYKTITNATVLSLQLDDWEYLLKYFPKCKRTIYNLPEKEDEDTTKRNASTEDIVEKKNEADDSKVILPSLKLQSELAAVGDSPASEGKADKDLFHDTPFARSWRDDSISDDNLALARQKKTEQYDIDKPRGKGRESVWKNIKNAMEENKDEPKKKKGARLEISANDDSDDDDDVYELTPEQLRRPSFVQKAMASAKKFLAKDLGEAAEAKDGLLVAQDEATTEALMKTIEQQNASNLDLPLKLTGATRLADKSEQTFTKKEDFLSRSYSFLGLNKGSQPELKSDASLDKFLKQEADKEEKNVTTEQNVEKPKKINLLTRIGDNSKENSETTILNDEKKTTTHKTNGSKSSFIAEKIEADQELSRENDSLPKSKANKNDLLKGTLEEIDEDDLKEPTKELNLQRTITDEENSHQFVTDTAKNDDETLKDEYKDNKKKQQGKVALALHDEVKYDDEDDDADVEKLLGAKKKKRILGLMSKSTKMEIKQEPEDDEPEKNIKRRPTAFTRVQLSDEDADDEEENKTINQVQKSHPTTFTGEKKTPLSINEDASDDEPPIGLKHARRISTVENVDRKAVEAELEALTSARPSNVQNDTELLDQPDILKSEPEGVLLDKVEKLQQQNETATLPDKTELKAQSSKIASISYVGLKLSDESIHEFLKRSRSVINVEKKTQPVEDTSETELKLSDESIHEIVKRSRSVVSVKKKSQPAEDTSETELLKPSTINVVRKTGSLEDTSKANENVVQRAPSLEGTLHTIASVVSESSIEDLMKKENENQLNARLARRTTSVRYTKESSTSSINPTQGPADDKQDSQKR